MPDRHDLPVVCPRRDGKAIGNGRFIRRERVVSRDQGGIGTIPKQRTAFIKSDLALLAVHQLFGVGDLRPERRTDRLMTEAYAEYRDIRSELFDGFDDDPRILGSAGTGREDDPVGL